MFKFVIYSSSVESGLMFRLLSSNLKIISRPFSLFAITWVIITGSGMSVIGPRSALVCLAYNLFASLGRPFWSQRNLLFASFLSQKVWLKLIQDLLNRVNYKRLFIKPISKQLIYFMDNSDLKFYYRRPSFRWKSRGHYYL